MIKRLFLLWALVASCLVVSAQTDYTSRITNPSFENDAEGWTHKGMGAQGNNVFTIKAGNTYMEKWTGRGGAVGDGYLKQEISNLPPGNYELTAAAQNIQEDTPTATQTGAWIFAGDIKTVVTVRDTYKVAFNFISGSITIGFEAVGATGNWIAVDNFHLTLVGTDLSAELTAAITATENKYGSATGADIQQLKDAIAAAKVVAANTSATADEQAAAIIAMEQAVEKYLCANASESSPMDMTSRITNPSFETGDWTAWTTSGMALQGNDVFNIKQGTWYAERWTGRGGAVGDGRVSQRITGLPAGRYRLTAAAQNIQEDTPTRKQTGAWIFAGTNTEDVNVRGTYTLVFEQVSDELEFGFEAKGATGNWISVDNFRLEYIGNSFDDIKAGMLELIAKAEAISAQRMNTSTQQTLQAAIDAAKPLLSQDNTDGWAEAARNLEAAYDKAVTSIEAFARLAEAIATANAEIAASSAAQKEDYQAAIDAAQAVYDNSSTTDAQAEAAIAPLQAAAFAFKVQNGSGTPPTVKNDPRFIRGCTWAFGRSTVSGSNIIEEGFCWSENPEPTVLDNRTTEYINQAGKVYWLRDLKPATVYYMRAYAINKNYAVGYGDVLKVVTVPKGTVGHWYNNGGDEETNDRINYAINTAIDYYWNNLTSIYGFGISVNYSPGTQTADCSYGGWMRVGASSSYQQPGTIMHEAFHGIGVGTHDIWWDGDLRSAGDRGDWLGDRVTEAVRFWDNSTTAVITGDNMHLWPYGCNGAHEDSHNDNLYCMMGILAQALNEDGLPASGEIGYALPYYAFNHEDDVKYYIKNEDASRGLHSAYLVETASHQLEWKTMDATEAAEDDAAAWYITFTPKNQYYQLRNAKTGYYITYSSGFKTASHASPTSADNIHLMRGRVDVEGYRGYYFIHPESNATPPTLIANASGKTGSAGWDIHRSATTQRWLILTGEQAEQFDNGNLDLAREELTNLLAQIRKLTETPHEELTEDADQTLAQSLTSIEQQAAAATKGSEVEQLTKQARAEGMTFLESVAATNVDQPFDLTFMLVNPNFTSSSTDGWTTNVNPGYEAQCNEFYQTTFNFYQVLENMPTGAYQLRVQAFQRAGEPQAAYTKYTAGTEKITTNIYINSTSVPVKSLYDDRQPTRLYSNGDASDIKLPDNTYIPNVMKGAATYFRKGLYDNAVDAQINASNASLRVGIRCTSAPEWYWSFFDNFRLYFFGGKKPTDGIEGPTSIQGREEAIYDLSGRRIICSAPRDASHLKNHQLRPGLYIIDGKKVLVK